MYPYQPLDVKDRSNPVVQALDNLLETLPPDGHLTPDDWFRFYSFAVISYREGASRRPRISQLSDIFRDHKVARPGSLAVIYAHILYALALDDGKAIFGEGFNP